MSLMCIPCLPDLANGSALSLRVEVCTSMFIATLFIVAKKWKQSKCLLTDKQMNKNPYHEMLFCHRIWYILHWYMCIYMIYILQYGWTLKILQLSERNQTQRTTYFMVPFIWNVQKRQIHREGKQINCFQGLRSGGFFFNYTLGDDG